MGIEFETLAGGIRYPTQKRSQASFRRILEGAKEVMRRYGNEEFTLAEVCSTSGCSIGSIYLRFESKDNLVRAAIAEELRDIATDERQLIDEHLGQSGDLQAFLRAYVAGYGVFLSEREPILRIAIQRAAHDSVVARQGKAVGLHSEAITVAALMAYGEEIQGGRNAEKAQTAYRIIFSTLARELGLGASTETAHWGNWAALQKELACVCLAYLTHAP